VNVRNPIKLDKNFNRENQLTKIKKIFTSSFEVKDDGKFDEEAILEQEAVAMSLLEQLVEEAAKSEQEGRAAAVLETEFDEDLRRALLLGPDGFSEGTIDC
jgi:NhaP-type Na+/H+ and K+/H+ antiporter